MFNRSTHAEARAGMLPTLPIHVAKALAAFGEKLSAGDVIITGSITPPPMIEADESQFTHTVDPIGEMTVNSTRE